MVILEPGYDLSPFMWAIAIERMWKDFQVRNTSYQLYIRIKVCFLI